MTQDLLFRIRELDDVTAVKLIRHVGRMLFKDPQIREVLNFPPSAQLRATLTDLSAAQKRETLSSERSIWLARALLAALASQPLFAEVLAQALESLRGDELVAEASVPRGLAIEIVRLLGCAREARLYSEARIPGESALVDLAMVALAPQNTPIPAPGAHATRAAPPKKVGPDLAQEGTPLAAPAADATAVTPSEVPSAPELCLNAWFPDQPGDVARLIVGVAARLCVNLGPARAGSAGSEVLPGEVVQQLREVPFVGVLILCAGADIKPLGRRLPLPPDPERILEFTLIPRRPGELEIQIVLLVHNEPIHRMRFPVTAVIPSDTAAAATWSQV